MIRKAAEFIKIPKKLFFTVLAIAIALAVVWSLWPKFTPVDLGEITFGTFQKSIEDEGITEFKDKHIIFAPADGITPNIDIEAGDPVRKGPHLFKFLWDTDLPVSSPVNGYVLRVFEKDRRHVPRGTPILEVGNPSSLVVVSKLLSEDVLDVQLGQKVLISNWGSEIPLEAEVIKIEPAAKEEVSALGVKEQRVNVHFKITTDKEVWKNLGDGFRVEISVIIAKKENTRLLPVGALFSSDGQPAIFVYENKKIKQHKIELGDRNKDFAELKTDLPAGTQVVLYPGSGLRAGDKVKPRLYKVK